VRDNLAEQAKPPRMSQKRVKTSSMDVVRAAIEAAEKRYPRPTQDDVGPSQGAQLTTAHAGESAQHQDRQIRGVPSVVIADRLRRPPCDISRSVQTVEMLSAQPGQRDLAERRRINVSI